jgi:hypothetical protein
MDDYRVDEANKKGIEHWMRQLRLDDLKRVSGEFVGPCPAPGCGGRDRFSISPRKGLFNCRVCHGKGDAVGLVMFVRSLKFKDALEWMCGPLQELSREELEKRAKDAEENKARKDREAAQFRARAIASARQIWAAGRPFAGSPAEDYLRLRGIVVPPASHHNFRFAPDLKYMVENPDKDARDKYVQVYAGPAMLAQVKGRDDDLCAVHRTWFDLTQPQGKLRIVSPFKDEVLDRKKGLGSKKGGAIRLVSGFNGNTTMVMGEGIETTFSAYMAGFFEGAHFWAGVDLGNMSGQRITVGKGMKYAGVPDLTDTEAFVPPAWVRRLVFIQDGDSETRATRAKLRAGLLRAKHFIPDLQAQIAPCPVGFDLNDVLLGAVSDAE